MNDIDSLNEYVYVFKAFRSLVKNEIGEMKDEDILTLFAIALKDGRATEHTPKPRSSSESKSDSGKPIMTSKQRSALEKWGTILGKSKEEIAEEVEQCKTKEDVRKLVGRYHDAVQDYYNKKKGGA